MTRRLRSAGGPAGGASMSFASLYRVSFYVMLILATLDLSVDAPTTGSRCSTRWRWRSPASWPS